MNINSLSAFNIYKSNSLGASSVGSVQSKTEVQKDMGVGEKTDKIEISSEASSFRDISKIVKSVMKEIEEFDNPSRIEEIKNSIENSTYKISAQQVAEEILYRLGE